MRSGWIRTASTSTGIVGLDRARPRSPAKVREYRADLGIALDGDADRVVLVDEKGPGDRRRPADGRRRRATGASRTGYPATASLRP
jgi:hypothetical protein